MNQNETMMVEESVLRNMIKEAMQEVMRGEEDLTEEDMAEEMEGEEADSVVVVDILPPSMEDEEDEEDLY